MRRSYRRRPDHDPSEAAASPDASVAGTRRQLLVDGSGIALSTFAFGVVYGLAASQAGFSVLEGMAMSVVVFAGAAQFAAVGLVAAGAPWLGIVGLTLLLNARHVLYASALAPWFAARSRLERGLSAHVLTDECFALVLPAFRRLGRHDTATYLLAAAIPGIPWQVATLLGMLGGGSLPEPTALGLDIVFPAAMGGLAVALITGRRTLAAAIGGAAMGVVAALLTQPSVGILAGGLAGPLIALLVAEPPDERVTAVTEPVPPPAGGPMT
jgi:4-azaleucine resistance transporter AzlC